MPTTSGDGWVEGPNGTQLWGKYGAAGLLLTAARTESVLMQHRATWTNQGGTWALPGWARDLIETAEEAAAREAYEETGISFDHYVFCPVDGDCRAISFRLDIHYGAGLGTRGAGYGG